MPHVSGAIDFKIRINSKTPCCFQLQAFFLVADDIMDASVTRRGQPCWYKKVTGSMSNNDIVLGLSVLFLFTLCVCFPGWNRAGCHQWLISVRKFHLQTTSQTLQGSALLHPPTRAIYRGSIAPRWWIERMHTQTGSLNHFCLRQTSFQTELGQALDLMTAPPGQIDLNRFTMDR